MVSLRDILNRARWRDDGLGALVVQVVHRGAPGDMRAIKGRFISAIRGGGIDVAPESECVDASFVPYHRFLAILGPDGDVLWSKGRGEPAPVVDRAPAPEPASKEITRAFDVVLQKGIELVIDGSVGEGGGQMLRTSLTLSLATGTPFVLENIRAGRKKPGLLRQHLTAVNAAAALSGATVEGAVLGSSRLVFRPGPVRGGDHVLDIGSAGSVGLVLQTIALPLVGCDRASRITIRGGTHALWAPAFPFLAQAWLPLVRRAGAKIGLGLDRVGFHPAGGGAVTLTTEPSGPLAPLHVREGALTSELVLRAIVAGLPEAIGARELAAAAELLADDRLDIATTTVDAAGKGNAMWLVARDETTGVANVFTGIGEVGVPAAQVGTDVASAFLAWRASGAAVEAHLADQLMLPIVLAGAGSFTCNELTLHAWTNIAVIEAFTGKRLRAFDLGDGRFRVEL